MDGGERPGVEFLDDDPLPPGEQLPAAPAGGLRARWLVLGSAAALLAGVVVARTAGSRPGPPPATAPSTPAAVVGHAVSSGPLPVTARPDLLSPVPKLLLLPTPHCPAPGCSVLAWVADATLNAVTDAVPDAFVDRQMTAFAPAGTGADHPLLAREVRARNGRETVVVDLVQAPRPAARDALVRRVGQEVHGTAWVTGYLIAVRVTGGGPDAAAQVQRMLADPGLMAVR